MNGEPSTNELSKVNFHEFHSQLLAHSPFRPQNSGNDHAPRTDLSTALNCSAQYWVQDVYRALLLLRTAAASAV